MRSSQYPLEEEAGAGAGWVKHDVFDAVPTCTEIEAALLKGEATLLERLEACELTWRIVSNGLLDDH